MRRPEGCISKRACSFLRRNNCRICREDPFGGRNPLACRAKKTKIVFSPRGFLVSTKAEPFLPPPSPSITSRPWMVPDSAASVVTDSELPGLERPSPFTRDQAERSPDSKPSAKINPGTLARQIEATPTATTVAPNVCIDSLTIASIASVARIGPGRWNGSGSATLPFAARLTSKTPEPRSFREAAELPSARYSPTGLRCPSARARQSLHRRCLCVPDALP